MLDILCDLADEQDTTIGSSPADTSASETIFRTQCTNSTTSSPSMNLVSSDDKCGNVSIDEDSILGTQCSKMSQASVIQLESIENASESDDEDDRETLEMSQIFCLDGLLNTGF